MSRTTVKLALLFVSGHLLLGLTLLGIEAGHGINDQDASFAVAILFHCLNLPTIAMLRSLHVAPGIPVVLLGGIAQWTVMGVATGAIYRSLASGFRAVTRSSADTVKPTGQADAPFHR